MDLPFHSKGDRSRVFIGRTDFEAETPIIWPPDAKSWLIWKVPDAGKYWRREEKGTTEDEMVGWHPWLDGHEFGQALGVGDAQGGLACCSPWGHKESDTTEWPNWTELKEMWELKAIHNMDQILDQKKYSIYIKKTKNWWKQHKDCSFPNSSLLMLIS